MQENPHRSAMRSLPPPKHSQKHSPASAQASFLQEAGWAYLPTPEVAGYGHASAKFQRLGVDVRYRLRVAISERWSGPWETASRSRALLGGRTWVSHRCNRQPTTNKRSILLTNSHPRLVALLAAWGQPRETRVLCRPGDPIGRCRGVWQSLLYTNPVFCR